MLTGKKQVFMEIARHASIAAILVGLSLLPIQFFRQSIVTMGDSLVEKENVARILSSRIENAEAMQAALDQVGDNAARIKEAYPPADNILELISALESVAAQNGLTTELSFDAPVEAINNAGIALEKTDFSIQVNGTVVTLSAYLKQIETLPFVLTLNSIRLVASAESGWNGDSTITISGTLYVRKTD